MIVIDSSVWIDYFNNKETRETQHLDDLLSRQRLLIGDLIMYEVLQGFRSDRDYRVVKTELDKFQFAVMGGYDIAFASAQNYRKLGRSGITPRKTIDVLIATFCIKRKHRLLHSDRDFDLLQKHLSLAVV